MVLEKPNYNFNLARLVQRQRRCDCQLTRQGEVGKGLKEGIAVEPFRKLVAQAEGKRCGKVGREHIQVALTQRVDHCRFPPVEEVAGELEHLHEGEVGVDSQRAQGAQRRALPYQPPQSWTGVGGKGV